MAQDRYADGGFMKKIGFIGAGNMGGALAISAKKSGAEVFLYDKDEDKAKALAESIGAAFLSNTEIAEKCDFVFLAVKPNIIPFAMAEIGDAFSKNKNGVLVSMAAGVAISSIAEESVGYPIIRIMPNTPAQVGEGLILWCRNSAVSDEALADFLEVMAPAGALMEIDEAKIDAASAISGCGPAFAYMFIEALADGGVECGLPRDVSQKLAAQTLLGAAKMVQLSGKHPGELKDAVCSPGGSTIEGVAALERGSFRAVASSAVRAAYEKTLKLGK